jgi:hypothetical protein
MTSTFGGVAMTRIVMKSKVSSDGVLHLSLPVGMREAGQEVQVTVESVAATKPLSPAEWSDWVDAMSGCWQGDFERPPQGNYEEREQLS